MYNKPCMCINVTDLTTGECLDSVDTSNNITIEELKRYAVNWLRKYRK